MPRHVLRLPEQWSSHVKSGILHAVALASVALSYARARAKGDAPLRAELDQAATEIALLREELSIKDGRWGRAQPNGSPQIHTTEPVNRYPDFARCLVRQLKTLFPTMGSVRIAQVLARVFSLPGTGVHLRPESAFSLGRNPHNFRTQQRKSGFLNSLAPFPFT